MGNLSCAPCARPPLQCQVVVIFSGKRKSGKDYVTNLLLQRLGEGTAEIGRLSAPLKKAYAVEHKLDYKKLLSDGPYKEQYRKDMIKWGELRRDKDPGYFARMVVEDAKKSILIISDARRPTDLEFFQNQLKEIEIVTVRVEASEKVRASRGWVYTEGVDNVASECGLDGREWDFVIRNDGPNTVPPLNASLEKLLSTIEGKMKEG
ncbi:hypothetical protein AAMO2058_000766300 [Amorphochlora amoebiformis]